MLHVPWQGTINILMRNSPVLSTRISLDDMPTTRAPSSNHRRDTWSVCFFWRLKYCPVACRLQLAKFKSPRLITHDESRVVSGYQTRLPVHIVAGRVPGSSVHAEVIGHALMGVSFFNTEAPFASLKKNKLKHCSDWFVVRKKYCSKWKRWIIRKTNRA